MSAYVRPEIAVAEYRDADGQVIPYGTRWADSPPETSYSVTGDLDRFAPLHVVADALIDWLVENFDAESEEDPDFAADLSRPPEGIVRAVRVTPADPSASALTFVFTSFPGVHLHYGHLQDAHSPVCGCDACDETWQSAADELEWTVRVVTAGGLAESMRPEAKLALHFSLRDADGRSHSGSTGVDAAGAARVAAVEDALRSGVRWAAWPRRS